MLELSHHIVHIGLMKLLFFQCNDHLLTQIERDENLETIPTRKWFGSAIIYVELRKHHICTWQLLKLFCYNKISIQRTYMYEYSFYSMFLLKTIFQYVAFWHLITVKLPCFCQEQQSWCFDNNECPDSTVDDHYTCVTFVGTPILLSFSS